MYRITPNGCTRRHMERFGRAGPRLKKSRGDPPHLRLVDAKQRYIEFEDVEKILLSFTQKERKS